MALLDQPAAEATAASVRARSNWEANISALAQVQPWVVEAAGAFDEAVTWVFGRDGFLTAQNVLGRWWAGCSLPKRAGAAMLKRLVLRGVVGCLLAPTHAGTVAAALEKVSAEQAIIIVQPEHADLRIMLGCCDFSQELRQNRLWIAAGAEWPRMLEAALEEQPGLPTPSQFIRTPATGDELVQELIPKAEQAFNRVNEARAARVEQARARRRLSGCNEGDGKLLVVGGTHFRLWDDAGAALASALRADTASVRHLDSDDPAQAAAAALALAAAECGAIVVANRGRGELPDVLAEGVRVVSWITEPRIPAFHGAHREDGLVMADEAWAGAARAAGWPQERLRVAGWPAEPVGGAAGAAAWALIVDTVTLETPVTELELSSHHLLWEMIRHDLARDPLSLGSDLDAFLDRRRESLEIAGEGLDRDRFVRRLILPAYQQGLAKLLLDAGVTLKLYGRGWDALAGLRDAWEGPVTSREGLRRAVAACGGLVYPWPARHRHELDSFGRPVLWTASRNSSEWIRQATLGQRGSAGRCESQADDQLGETLRSLAR